jgi:hypothetical protein
MGKPVWRPAAIASGCGLFEEASTGQKAAAGCGPDWTNEFFDPTHGNIVQDSAMPSIDSEGFTRFPGPLY